VFNREFSRFSPGLVLLAKIIGAAPALGIDEIDLAEGMTGYKALFSNEFYPIYRGVWHRGTVRGLAYRGHLSLRWRINRMRKWH
jgi:CelD/BcsL family acetyltransferase involved in cellulose biosynthesis